MSYQKPQLVAKSPAGKSFAAGCPKSGHSANNDPWCSR